MSMMGDAWRAANGWERRFVSPFPTTSDKPCPACSTGRMILRVNGKTGDLFIGCSRFPACDWKRKTNWYASFAGGRTPAKIDANKACMFLYGKPASAFEWSRDAKPTKWTPPKT